jgi:hypothetical protein
MIIDEIKVGDTLIEHYGYGRQRRPVQVTKVFKRYFEAGNTLWNGGGFRRGGDQWARGRVTLPRPGELEQIALERKTRKAAQRLMDTDWRSLPLETLQAAIALLPEEPQEDD